MTKAPSGASEVGATETEAITVRYVALSRTPQVGAPDQYVAVRVVPDGHEGNVVFARTLRPREKDRDVAVIVNPARGETLAFRDGALRITIKDVDRHAAKDLTGYAPVTNTVWTWTNITGNTKPEHFRLALAAARRLYGTHAIYGVVQNALTELRGTEINQRVYGFRAMAVAEVLVVSLYRATEMIMQMSGRFRVKVSVPTSLLKKREAIARLRDAFEHIDARAFGKTKNPQDPEALSVFDQRQFFVDGTLTYGKYALQIPSDVPELLCRGRDYLINAVGALCGAESISRCPITFFDQASNVAG
jgi:hypothetical protein